jgi:hypothetical protein
MEAHPQRIVLSRRTFLQRFGIGVGAAALVPSAINAEPTMSDDFRFRGWRIQWLGWQRPINQAIHFGVWIASRPDTQGFYATTLGTAWSMNRFDVFDTSYQRDWPNPSLASGELETDAQRDAVKRRALLLLSARLGAA